MEFKEDLMLETKELMNSCINKLREAFEIFEDLQNNPELLSLEENLIDNEEEEAEKEYVDEYDDKKSDDCHCCKPSYPCDCRKCDTLFNLANKENALAVYAFNQALENARDALRQLEDARNFYEDSAKHYIKSIYCFKKNHCKDFCKRSKNGDWHYTSCICKD